MTDGHATLRVCTFQGLQNLPLVTARRLGFLDHAGLDIVVSYTSSSAQQLGALASHEYDVIHTAPDNVINFDTNPAAFAVNPADAPRVVMLMGGSNGPLGVFARPEISSEGFLRGRPIGVDNPGSGFALVLRDLLAAAGLTLGRDYSFVVAGGTAKRAQALLAGELAATILYPPFDLQVARAGCRLIASSVGAYPAYASQALAATQPWVETHGDLVRRYIGALLRALSAIYDPDMRPEIEALLVEESALGLGTLPAADAYAAFTDPRHGFGRTAELDPAGLAQVIALRARYGGAGAVLGEPMSYCDARWYDAARREVRDPAS